MGEQSDLRNDRGIFKLSCIRTILDKLIYLDKYDHIDSKMSDANVGARRGRNIRNHLFIANGILNSVKNKELQKVDVQIYDLKQAFDTANHRLILAKLEWHIPLTLETEAIRVLKVKYVHI